MPPVVVAIEIKTPRPGSDEGLQSVVNRWEAVEQRQSIHSAIEELGGRRNSVSTESANTITLRRLDRIVIDKIIIGLHTIQFGRVIVLTFTDGSLEYRDRASFEQLYTAESLNKVMTLRQAGWSFADSGSCKTNMKRMRNIHALTGTNRFGSCTLAHAVLYGRTRR